jgi:hypothetical protein
MRTFVHGEAQCYTGNPKETTMTTKLNPTAVTEANMGDVAFDGTRKRPVVAINDEGQLVVCCRRTAAKHGWKLEGTLHQRTRTAKPVKAETPAATPAKPAAKKTTSKKADPVIVASVEDLLK